MRLTTWNVNGIRNPFAYQPWNSARSYPAMFDILGSDIVVMQELKIQRKDLKDDMVILDGWDCYFSLPKHKKGYSGVGIYTRNATCAPIKAEEGLLGVLPSPSGTAYRDLQEDHHIGGYPSEAQIHEWNVDPVMLDAEGRCVAVEFPAFVLLGVYCPANSNGLRDDFRHGFICALDCRIRNLIKKGKAVILVGDLNVSRDERDGASAVEDCRKAGISHEDYVSTPNRRIFNQLLIEGEVIGERDAGREDGVLWDTTRAFHPDRRGMYTHWEQKVNARPGNYGSRIDFVLVSAGLRDWVKDANIQEGLLGSDHCPVFIDFHDDVSLAGEHKKLLDVMSNAFENGVRQKEWKVQEVPAFSGRRLPEFTNRRSIKSMFAATLKKTTSSFETAQSRSPSPTKQGAAKQVSSQPAALVKQESKPEPATLSKQESKSEPASKQEQEEVFERAPSGSPGLKRKSSATTNLPVKKTKENGAQKGQQSLRGFFAPKQASNGSKQAADDDVAPPKPVTIEGLADHLESHADVGLSKQSNAVEEPYSPTSTDMTVSPSKTMQNFEAREQTHHSWNALFSKPIAPICEHGEPCKTMLTKKKGSNQGRSFWMCARPLGPSGNKEKNTQWRCATFIWCSDARGSKDVAARDAG